LSLQNYRRTPNIADTDADCELLAMKDAAIFEEAYFAGRVACKI
jgi:hypothetical protein